MKRLAKMFAVTCVAALALAAISAAGAQAASKFTASATGTLSGTQTSNQVLTFSSGGSENVTCKEAATTGAITAVEYTAQEVTAVFSNCIAATSFGNITATVSNGTLNLTADGVVHILNTITIHIGGIANCNIVVAPQTPAGSISYSNSSGKVVDSFAVTGIVSTSTGLCPHGTTGTLVGSNIVGRVGGGTFSFDP